MVVTRGPVSKNSRRKVPPQKLAQRGHKEHSRCVHENIDARGNGKPKPSSVEEPFNRAAALLSDSLYQLLVRATACDHPPSLGART